ncbi:MAG: ribosome hibernation-promoting factor, HPF/YfiA family [Tannerellaceae bacterium]|nr:ribosome-associated translation inhibitor RaiA [Porphyromonadaceae bacterium]
MEVRIQAIHFDASSQLESFITKKVSKLDHIYDGIVEADVVLRVVKPESALNKEASIKLLVKNDELFAEKVCDTFEEAIDLVVDALAKQLGKYKEKMRNA